MGFRKQKDVQQVIQIQGNIEWEVAFDPNSRMWVGVCRMLNLNAIGETWIEFQECAADAMGALFLDLFRSGEFESFLRENGWQPLSALPERGSTPRFDVPFEVRRTGVRELTAAYA